MKIIRVFPSKTKATPDDPLAFFGPPDFFVPDADEVHVSCTFTWDKPRAEWLTKKWMARFPIVKLGGPAYDDPGGDFTPGVYLKPGYTVTTRGCPNHCSFCFVPKREGLLRELPIRPGWDVFDNNLLAASRQHIEAVMEMLGEQPHSAKFTGGIEAARVTKWWARRAVEIKTQILYTAFDRPGERGHVERAIKTLRDAGLSQRAVACYVLVGYNGDCLTEAERRLQWVFDIGAVPFAMFFRPASTTKFQIPKAWRAFVRGWCRPAAIFAKNRQRLQDPQMYTDARTS